MGSPLDELRQIKKQVADTQDAIKNNQRLQKEKLANSTVDKKLQRDAYIKEINKKSKKLKAFFLACGLLLVALVIFFMLQCILLSDSKKLDVKLLTDERKQITANDNSYLKLSTFTDKIIDTYKKKPSNSTIPWYHSLPAERRERYKKILDEHINMPGLSFTSVNEEKDDGIFQVVYTSTDGNYMTIELVYNDDFKLRVVKIH